jgi:hypothetical protein
MHWFAQLSPWEAFFSRVQLSPWEAFISRAFISIALFAKSDVLRLFVQQGNAAMAMVMAMLAMLAKGMLGKAFAAMALVMLAKAIAAMVIVVMLAKAFPAKVRLTIGGHVGLLDVMAERLMVTMLQLTMLLIELDHGHANIIAYMISALLVPFFFVNRCAYSSRFVLCIFCFMQLAQIEVSAQSSRFVSELSVCSLIMSDLSTKGEIMYNCRYMQRSLRSAQLGIYLQGAHF